MDDEERRRIYSYTTQGIDNRRTLSRDAYVNEFVIPKGMTWDGASVPRPAQVFVQRWGENSGAFLTHDYLYSAKHGPADITRKQADKILYRDLRANGVGRVRAYVVYKTVDLFGWMFFRKGKDDDIEAGDKK